jgi:mannose-6-phosphate isomerase-like protein (cupin superfamily)
MSANYEISRFADLNEVRCPCGMTRRAFVSPDNDVATIHVVDIRQDAKTHYHKRLTEIYYILEGTGHMELNGELNPVEPMTAILIKPLCRHRAVGQFKIINVVIPPFDSKDEWFD